MFEFLESFIRRMVVHANTKNYNQLFTDRLISHQILSKQEFTDFLETQSDRINFFPTDDELKNGFHSEILVNKQTGQVFCIYLNWKSEIEVYNRHKFLGISKYSLEHLMPKKWENHWGKLSNQEDRIKRNRKLLTIWKLDNYYSIFERNNPRFKLGDKEKRKRRQKRFATIFWRT